MHCSKGKEKLWSEARNTKIIDFNRKETNNGHWKKGEGFDTFYEILHT